MEHNHSMSSSSESLASDRMEGVIATTPQDTQTITPPASGGLEKGLEQGRPGTPHSRTHHPDSPPIPAEPSTIDPYSLSHFFVVDSFNIHRLVIAGVTCASKFFSDIFYTNSRYAKVSILEYHILKCLLTKFRSVDYHYPSSITLSSNSCFSMTSVYRSQWKRSKLTGRCWSNSTHAKS